MKQVIVAVQPFVFEQKIFLFEDQNLLMQISVPLNELTGRIIKTSYDDDAPHVSLQGDPNFTNKIKQEIFEQEMLQYGKNQLEVVVV